MATKKLINFTVEELVHRAIGDFGEQDPQQHAKFEDERHALYAVLNFKVGQEQSRLNESIRSLTAQLVWLTWVLVILTVATSIKMFY